MIPAVLKEWESYYVIVGSSAGALTGLQFVVLTLISESGRMRSSERTLAAFASPNVLHFCLALFVSAVMSAPWSSAGPPQVALLVCGLFGVGYSIAVMRRAVRQSDYRPVLEDWVWHGILPFLAYAGLAVGAEMLVPSTEIALDLIGGAALLLVFVGIHNAWDTVVYVMVEQRRDRAPKPPPAPPKVPPPASTPPPPPAHS